MIELDKNLEKIILKVCFVFLNSYFTYLNRFLKKFSKTYVKNVQNTDVYVVCKYLDLAMNFWFLVLEKYV